MIESLALRRGASGEAVRDLQGRLGALGFRCDADPPGSFGVGTLEAVRAFQRARGLAVDGEAGPETWGAVVESGFSLGDRLLYERRPMLRGDDVATLQRRLNALGFDAGREDGIFGPATGAALRELQRNTGLAVDGVAGPETLAGLVRVGALAAGSVASVRERERLREAPPRTERVLVVAWGGLEALADVVGRGLGDAGLRSVYEAGVPSEAEAAERANRFDADLCLGLRAGDAPGCRCSYFATPTFRSETGLRFARAIQRELASVVPGTAPEPAGRTYRLLRETRMASVAVEPVAIDDVEAMRGLVANLSRVGHAIVSGVLSASRTLDDA